MHDTGVEKKHACNRCPTSHLMLLRSAVRADIVRITVLEMSILIRLRKPSSYISSDSPGGEDLEGHEEVEGSR